MNTLLTRQLLRRQNEELRGTGGVSAGNQSLGFVPAFLDSDTGQIYRSCFRDGRPAPCHLLEGLPGDVCVERDNSGRTTAVKATVVVGFVRGGCFYTREQARLAVADECCMS
jgi:hypothetical protein